MKQTITTTDGLSLHSWLWPGERPRGILILSHGLGEHLGCYALAAEALAAVPGLVNVLGFDYRGHGLSPGRRGFVRRFDDLTLDLDAALAWAGRAYPGMPRFVLGHSNGGQVSLHVALDKPATLDGLILSNPNLAVATEVPPWKLAVGRILNQVAPWVTLDTGLRHSQMSRDSAALSARLADPLRHRRVSPPLYFGMLAGGLSIAPRAGEIRMPVLMILGESDPVVDVAANRAFFDRLASDDRTLRTFPEMLHEPLNEIGREHVLAEIIQWLTRRLDRHDERG